MEQVQLVRNILTVSDFSPRPLGPLPRLHSYQLIVLSSTLALFLALLTGSSLPIHLISGLLLPLLLLSAPDALADYWPWFSVVLLGRSLSGWLVALDVTHD